MKTNLTLKGSVLGLLALIGTIAIFLFVINTFTNVIEDFSDVTASSSEGYATELSGMPVSEAFLMADVDDQMDAGVRSMTSVKLSDGTVVDPKIIKTGRLDLTVENTDAATEDVAHVATTNDGYLENTNVYERGDGTRYATLTLRVPVENFAATLQGVKGYALVVEREQISANDVTEDYVDKLARLNNAKAQENRYLAILEKAETVEDILSVERYLSETRELIERYQGQINYLDSQTSMSTITVSLEEEPTVEIGGKQFRPGTTITIAIAALIAIAQGLVNLSIWLVIVGGGVGLPVALLVWLFLRWKRSRS